jgi:hypothetical protein
MLISELNGWHYIITWDNPVPANSSAILSALNALGNVTTLNTKTTVALSPKTTTKWQDIRHSIETNINPKTGSAVYVNVKSGKSFHIGSKTKFLWKSTT